MLTVAPEKSQTLADLLRELGDIAPSRVRLKPAPGTATVGDVIRIRNDERRLFELVDGVLVEKVMGHPESRVASALIAALERYLEGNDLGAVTGEGGMFHFPDNLVRIPDVAFARWERFPNLQETQKSVPSVVPDFAVEVLSQSNTPREMSRKLKEYFKAGVQLVWIIDLDDTTVTTYISPTKAKTHLLSDMLDGGKVLPGFQIPVAKLFSRLSRTP